MPRLVAVTGDKGGVGKSFMARVLSDWYISEGKNVRIFDTDKSNSTLYRFYKNTDRVRHLDLDEPEQLDNLLEEISQAKEDDVFLVDFAARSLDSFHKWMIDIDLKSLKDELKLRFTLAFILGPEKDCLMILKDVCDQFEDSVDYVIIKNLAKGKDFDLYNKSQTRKLLLEGFGALELTLHPLLDKTALAIDRLNLPLSDAITHQDIQIADRSRIRVFKTKMKDEITQGGQRWM